MIALSKNLGIKEESLRKPLYKKPYRTLKCLPLEKGTVAIQDIQIIDGEISDDKCNKIVLEVRNTLRGIRNISKLGVLMNSSNNLKILDFDVSFHSR